MRTFGRLPLSLRGEAWDGFVAAVRDGVGANWSDSAADLRGASRASRRDVSALLDSGMGDADEMACASYAAGRDLGLAWIRRREGR